MWIDIAPRIYKKRVRVILVVAWVVIAFAAVSVNQGGGEIKNVMVGSLLVLAVLAVSTPAFAVLVSVRARETLLDPQVSFEQSKGALMLLAVVGAVVVLGSCLYVLAS